MTGDRRLFLCTDMDRTLLPNGVQPESPQARKRFKRFTRLPEVTLAYVTGRDKRLVEQAIENYRLPTPDYAITDVGTKIYHIVDGEWLPLHEWEEEIDVDWHGKSHRDLCDMFKDLVDLQLQEPSKQNTHKLSYYIALYVDKDSLMRKMEQRLADAGVDASLIWSIDEPKGIGLLDVLPRNATKLHAVDFLRRHLHCELNQVVFAGDSGNDLAVMASPIPSVLVANASSEMKQSARVMAEQNGNQDALYLASGDYLPMNGNYSAGVLEGVWHFEPEFRPELEEAG